MTVTKIKSYLPVSPYLFRYDEFILTYGRQQDGSILLQLQYFPGGHGFNGLEFQPAFDFHVMYGRNMFYRTDGAVKIDQREYCGTA